MTTPAETVDSIVAAPAPQHVGEDVIMEEQPRKKGREKLLQNISRISSFPTLTKMGRARSASAPYRGNGSLSCASLSMTASPFAPSISGSYFGPMSPDLPGSAATTVPPTPGLEIPHEDGDEYFPPVRKIEDAEALSKLKANASVSLPAAVKPKKPFFSLWSEMPYEIKVHVLSFFRPKDLVRISRVNKEFHQMCFDGQLWTSFDASEFYRTIPAESVAKIVVAAGPFIKDLNLRGCVQVEHYKRAEVVVKACKNLINATLEGCRNFQKSTLHNLLRSNEKLANLNLTGLTAVTNSSCKIVAESCPQLEMFNVSWCKHMDARGIKMVLEGCPKLRDLRAGEIGGFDSISVAETIFKTNKLERLVLSGCDELSDEALQVMIQGKDPEFDILTDRPLVPARKLRHLDLSRCVNLTSEGVKTLGYLVPELEGLQLSGCVALTDEALIPILASTPRLTHLDLEDVSELTNDILSKHLAKSPCASVLEHLSISYCDNLGDPGMLPVMRAGRSLRSVDMDNTRVSDLVLAEAASMVLERSAKVLPRRSRVGLSLVVYDCQNITWTGILEVLTRNTEIIIPANPKRPQPALTTRCVADSAFATEVIALKCFYGWQMTVDEHTKRVLRGDVAAAARLERKWADYMQANEEAGAGGAGVRRRRRRAREAAAAHAHEEGEGGGLLAAGRRRARTAASCAVM